ncbi:type III secretion system effector XopAV [Xanthomonas graminis]|uniref:Uncharacterized protein n=1 Tax=Xanthomonas graminis pv. poae TaxID=227946 RepID=A0A199P7C1_9XANT|nr:type III secretion system effector XopAV [Xanthomonas translucens]OAX56895.1 hypothetical protein A6R73_12025 [Xanthomonas translucens pv. poae]
MTSATRRVARHTQDGVATEPEASSSARAQDPHANTQLVQNLPRPPVREAPLRAAQPHEQAAGVRVANVVRSTANNLARGSGVVSGFATCQSFFNMIHGYGTNTIHGDLTHNSYHGLAWDRGKIAMGAAAAYGGFKAIESLASRYIQVQAQIPRQSLVQKADRARELWTTEACLDKAIEMVTMPDDDGPGPHLSVGEQTALAKDLLNVITAERSRLPPELWNAASNVGDDAHELVNRLLLAARDRAAQQASTSSAG